LLRLTLHGTERLGLVVDSKVVDIQGAENGAMNPTCDAVDGNGKDGDTKDRLLRDPVLLYAGRRQNCTEMDSKLSIRHKIE
jgi:hypothetical protein